MENITKDRDKYIGGSDVPKIMEGKNLYKLALEKLNPTFEGNSYTHYGQFMEPLIREHINFAHDYNFQPDTVYDGIYRANCDGVDYTAKKLLEIKTYGSEEKIKEYMWQIQTYLHLFDIPVCMLVTYKRPFNFFMWGDVTDRQSYNLRFDENALQIYYIPRVESDWKRINKKATKFSKGLVALGENHMLSEQQFNKIVYGSQLVEMLENWQDPKILEKLLIKEDIYKAQIGDIHINRTDINEITLDVKRLLEDFPEGLEEYQDIKKTTSMQIRRIKNATN